MADDPLKMVEALGDIAGTFDTIKLNLIAKGWSPTNAELAAIAAVQAAAASVAVKRPPA